MSSRLEIPMGYFDAFDREVARALDERGDAIVRNAQAKARSLSAAIPPGIRKVKRGTVDGRGPVVGVKLNDPRTGRAFIGYFFEKGTKPRYARTRKGVALSTPAYRGVMQQQPFLSLAVDEEIDRPLDIHL